MRIFMIYDQKHVITAWGTNHTNTVSVSHSAWDYCQLEWNIDHVKMCTLEEGTCAKDREITIENKWPWVWLNEKDSVRMSEESWRAWDGILCCLQPDNVIWLQWEKNVTEAWKQWSKTPLQDVGLGQECHDAGDKAIDKPIFQHRQHGWPEGILFYLSIHHWFINNDKHAIICHNFACVGPILARFRYITACLLAFYSISCHIEWSVFHTIQNYVVWNNSNKNLICLLPCIHIFQWFLKACYCKFCIVWYI